jgi:pilus assembly protein CpaF
VARPRVFDLAELIAARSVPEDGAGLLAALVAARVAFLVTGGTGTGKTTLLSALLSLVDPADRLLLVEDAGELAPAHPHVVRLEARPPNVEGAGEVGLRDLVRQALRMRPDRVVVGEVRGGEVVDLLAALNTGHEGGCGTLHANSARDVPGPARGTGSGRGSGPGCLAQPAGVRAQAGRPPGAGPRHGSPAGGRDLRPGPRPGRAGARRAGVELGRAGVPGPPGPGAPVMAELLAG